MPKPPSVSIIGAGPAGLMAAEVLSLAGIQVDVYDAMPSAGRKFLMAGKGGLNITHSEAFPQFLSRYGKRSAILTPMLNQFSPERLREWVLGLGVTTFIGSSGRVFPAEMKAAPLLRAWLHRLRSHGVHFHMRHVWQGWTVDKQLRFSVNGTQQLVQSSAVVLALGGGSWPQLGSNAAWLPVLEQYGISIAPLQPANCGFSVSWSEYLRQHHAGQPLKPVRLSFTSLSGAAIQQQGELIVTEYGLEGGLIYAVSAVLREEITTHGTAAITLDLLPDLTAAEISTRLNTNRGKASWTNHLRKRLGVDAIKFALLRETLTAADLNNIPLLAATLKALPVKLLACRPLAEAISTAGGVCFSSLNDNLMLKTMPGVFCAGEMLDWEAPTGGYLLTACLATGQAAGVGVLDWLRGQEPIVIQNQ
ncbi:TIGR03862 family flavoprotein [Methylomonas paludis]|uniref:TIGR03862 family flavoprotein n=1 Tax=Methylomonas paludis TaxID=1173101 RepID=A0A975R9Y3_9GAMM|nr:TIGR03862 family flavoprotein [Methylomonas paludis]QWF70758.1 TIGR03862 family flavoprotein [Methylomonas paludis]